MANNLNSVSLEGKVAVVTGGHSGIGLYFSKALLIAGAKVAMLARRAEVLEQAAADLEGEVMTAVCDIRDPSSVAEVFASIEQRFGAIDILINNAATFTLFKIGESSDEELQRTVETNFSGVLYCCREAIKSMRANKRPGHIITISSESVADPFPFLTAYAASKAAVETLMKGLKRELKKDNIRTGILRLGAVIVPGRHVDLGGDPERVTEFFNELVAAGKVNEDFSGMAPETVASALIQMLTQPENASVDFFELRTS